MALKHARNRPSQASSIAMRPERERGFTLIELLVVVSILVVITGLMLISNNKFGGKILLENLAYDIALTARQAQVYGISVRQFEGGSENTFNLGYGVYFSTSDEDDRQYILFGDVNRDGLWQADEDVDLYTIERGYEIEKICVPAGVNAEDCQADANSKVHIIFRRPEPDACISVGNTSSVQYGSEDDDLTCNGEDSARIVLISPRGDLASVVIESSGQIHVE